MQLLARVADAADQLRLREAVDVLAAFIDFNRPGVHILPDSRQSLQDLVPLPFRQYPLLRQHGHMGHAALNVLMEKTPVKAYGRIEVVDQPVCLLCKAPAP